MLERPPAIKNTFFVVNTFFPTQHICCLANIDVIHFPILCDLLPVGIVSNWLSEPVGPTTHLLSQNSLQFPTHRFIKPEISILSSLLKK